MWAQEIMYVRRCARWRHLVNTTEYSTLTGDGCWGYFTNLLLFIVVARFTECDLT